MPSSLSQSSTVSTLSLAILGKLGSFLFLATAAMTGVIGTILKSQVSEVGYPSFGNEFVARVGMYLTRLVRIWQLRYNR